MSRYLRCPLWEDIVGPSNVIKQISMSTPSSITVPLPWVGALGPHLHGALHPQGLPVLQGQHQQASSFPSLLPPTTQGHRPLCPQEAPQILHCGSLLWAQSCVLESEKPGLISWHPHFLTCLGASSSVSVKWDDHNSPRIIPGPGCRTSHGVSSTGVVLGHQRPSGSWRVGAVSSWLPALSTSAAPQTAWGKRTSQEVCCCTASSDQDWLPNWARPSSQACCRGSDPEAEQSDSVAPKASSTETKCSWTWVPRAPVLGAGLPPAASGAQPGQDRPGSRASASLSRGCPQHGCFWRPGQPGLDLRRA